jgi:hypothetical protein
MTIYAKQLSEDTYCLVNERGDSVGLDGDLAHYPYFYNGLAKNSQWPEFLEEQVKDE